MDPSDPRIPSRTATYRIQRGCTAGRWSFAVNDEMSARLRFGLGVYWDADDVAHGFYPPGGSLKAHDYWCIVDCAGDE